MYIMTSLKVALSFDDISTPVDQYMDRWQIAAAIIKAHKINRLPSSIFYSNSFYPEFDELKKLWNQYSEVGEIANHTHSHKHYGELSSDQFRSEVLATQELINHAGHRSRFFRYPFLEMPATSEEAKENQDFLKSHGIEVGAPTCDCMDWYIELNCLQHYKKLEDIPLDEYINGYCNIFIHALLNYQKINLELFNGQYPLVMLMHANTLNALALDSLVKRLADMNVQFVGSDQLVGILNDDWKYPSHIGKTYLSRKVEVTPEEITKTYQEKMIDQFFEKISKRA